MMNSPPRRQLSDYCTRRNGLVRSPEHWRNSSAAWYLSERVQAVDVPLTALAW